MKGTAITIGQAGSTMMYCAEAGVMDQESAYLALLPVRQGEGSRPGNESLAFSDANGIKILSVLPDQVPARHRNPLSGQTGHWIRCIQGGCRLIGHSRDTHHCRLWRGQTSGYARMQPLFRIV